MRETTVGTRIKYGRLDLGWTPERLAVELNVAHRSVARWESGENMPSPRSAKKLADALGGAAKDYLEVT